MRNVIEYLSYTWTDADLRDTSANLNLSLTGRQLDVDTATFTVSCADDLSGYAKNTPVLFYRDGSQYALWYLARITRIGPELWTFSLISSLGLVAQLAHKGGVYGAANTGTMRRMLSGDLIREICGYEDGVMTVVEVHVEPEFEDAVMYGYLPYVSPSGETGVMTGSAKDNLMQVLFALNATITESWDGSLHVQNLIDAPTWTIGRDRVYKDGASVRYEAPVTSLTVVEHNYSSGSQEQRTLFDGAATGSQAIIFSEPMESLTVTGLTVVESGANYAVVTGTGTLLGTPYIHTTREITRAVSSAPVPNTIYIDKATLVGLTASASVCDRLVEYYRHRTWIEEDAALEFTEPGDVVSLYDPFDRAQRSACIESMQPLIFSQTLKGRLSALVGYSPWQVVPYDDIHQMLTDSGTFTVPEGVSSLTIVLIGKGYPGNNGGDGNPGVTHRIIMTGSGSRSVSNESGGAGGAGGLGGAGGKICRVDLAVVAGDTFTYNATTADVTFGSHSSSSGASNAAGYADPSTGVIYALPGDTGQPGAAGGEGGQNGENYLGWFGGVKGINREGSADSDLSWGVYTGGGGGGAAYGSNGGAAPNSPAYDNAGGAGASAYAPAAETAYGKGGKGGNGGGGGGGTGAASVSAGGYGAFYSPPAAPGGAGSAGGEGGPGCIHIYYRLPQSN